jgi:hypothetical protein
MNLLKSFTLNWRQAALYKIGMGALGILIGTYWHELFAGYVVPLCAVGVGCLAYVTYVWWRQ